MRQEILLNDHWTFTKPGEAAVVVNVPHTWNNVDGADGGNDYWRGSCTYERAFPTPSFDPATQEVWLQFDGVNASADVTLNGQHILHHDGGYSTFRSNITAFLAGKNNKAGQTVTAKPDMSGKELSHTDTAHPDINGTNRLVVQADNSVNDHVYPQKADFTFYGGIYRDVRLLVVSRAHIALGQLGGCGVKITPHVDEYDHSAATIRVETSLENTECTANQPDFGSPAFYLLRVNLLDQNGHRLDTLEGTDVVFDLRQPHLWDGVADPYLYTVQVQLLAARAQDEPEDRAAEAGLSGEKDNHEIPYGATNESAQTVADSRKKQQAPVIVTEDGYLVVDEVQQRCGIRNYHIDAREGFCLNGRPYRLHGVSRHQDRKGLGNAITDAMHEEDMALIREVGANAIRLAHYQHAQHFYDLCDEYGMIVWAEIPYISEHLPFGRQNTILQMRELITQNYNHASICVWGISNEITISTRDKKDMLDNHVVLNNLCHEMDPTRPTTLACYAMCGPFNKVAHITDVVAWNLYLGWYVPGFFLNDLWVWFFHLVYPRRALAYSEYGAEGMPNIHAAKPRRGDQSEEYQAIYHEYMLRFFERHPWMWGSFVWNMFDFAADARDQGGEPGMNHKGLVTYDRKIRKDAFYLYKAWWADPEADPFVHICSKRFVNRTGNALDIKVYSNQPAVTLYANGRKIDGLEEKAAAPRPRKKHNGTGHAEDRHIFRFRIPQDSTPEGATIQVQAIAGKAGDTAIFRHTAQEDPSYIVKKSTRKSNWV